MDFLTLAEIVSTRQMLRHLGVVEEDNQHPGQTLGGTEIDESRPLLTPSAEAELFLLASNFLLYVAMIIITTMVAKIYFPESLERGRASQEGLPRSRSYSLRMVDGVEISEDDDYYASDSDSDGAIDEDEVLGSDGSESDQGDPSMTDSWRRNASGSLLEFDQEKMSKTEVLRRLVFCCLMLNLTFVTWGILQERMLTRRYPRFTGEKFVYTYALVFTNRLWTVIFSGLLLLYLRPKISRTTVIYEYSFPAISNMLSSWCQYEALRYVSFPSATLFKSFKLAPVMAMGKILGNKTYPQYDYMVALVIGIGITMFMTTTDDISLGYDIYGEQVNEAWTGIMLLGFFLFFDSFTSQWQSRMFQRHRDMSLIELMFATSAFSTVLAFITLVHSKELYLAITFVIEHSEIHLHFFMFSICSTIGQLVIYYTIKNFGAVVFTLIMTFRILLSIAISCFLYGHKVTGLGFIGLMLVMGAVFYRIKRKAEGQQLVKWQGINEPEQGKELLHEWHEHGDM
eukprot:CAMPEP_0195289280 /NCGR_PEP_ID=MMETSP0707-20130614/5625_1 /TAXON_ID=33640 /ORGANISM="Asterionellopsis glacialis, Strain CCMP134" /LENGTH=511 /DNA_ID=CAMNT_0040349269 /DNA_START=107 /DNA_END=1642 /DNA_ORIENTATION=+